MPSFNLLEEAGIPQRKERSHLRTATPKLKRLAAKLDFLFYDGDRKYGCGGYVYDGRWRAVAELAVKRYNLNKNSRVLIDRCHKGFFVFDLKKMIPGISVYGLHPKEYALNHSMDGYGLWALAHEETKEDPRFIEQRARDEISPFLIKGPSNDMPFKDGFFDTVISIENACAYPKQECIQVIREIIRVSKGSGRRCYIQNDSWKNEEERKALLKWSVLCKTFLDIKEWEKIFREVGYDGDWGFTIVT